MDKAQNNTLSAQPDAGAQSAAAQNNFPVAQPTDPLYTSRTGAGSSSALAAQELEAAAPAAQELEAAVSIQ